MRSKLLAILLSSAVAVILLLGIDYIGCLMRTCETDDASNRASAILGMPLLFAYLAFSWLMVFPSMLAVRRWLGLFGASFALSLTYSLALAWLFYMPAIDGSFFYTAKYLLPWLAIPWFIGGLVVLAVWPTLHSSGTALPQ